jgi:ubiquitin C-terminal hydrolase
MAIVLPLSHTGFITTPYDSNEFENEKSRETEMIDTAIDCDGGSKNGSEYVNENEKSTGIIGNAAVESNDEIGYGSLINIGNSCYMASAIQLLAGLDRFKDKLKRPPTALSSSSVSASLTNVFERLAKGDTFRPEDFKRHIDSRTTLFTGFFQQDSHEFVTTLLDLIDEEYKAKALPEANSNLINLKQASQSTENDIHMNARTEHGEESNNDISDQIQESDQKKQKMLNETLDSEEIPCSTECSTNSSISDNIMMVKSKSFSEFAFSDIENLLFEDKSPTTMTFSSLDRETEKQQCKLAGGQMSKAGLQLTRYVKDNVGHDDGTDHFNFTSSMTIDKKNDDIHVQLGEEADEGNTDCCAPYSPISDFSTEVRVSLTCESCKFRRSHTETYLHLSVEIGSECSSIQDGLRHFFSPEKREIKCEKCFHMNAIQTSEITKLPRNLLFHLKRFIVDVSPDYTSVSYRKDQSAVSFKETIKLEELEDEDDNDYVDYGERGFEEFLSADVILPKGSAYEIRSVVNHVGSSANCGHYFTDAKKLHSNNKNNIDGRSYDVKEKREKLLKREWIRFNDSYVTKISKLEAVHGASQTAYMLMYEFVEE